MAMTFPDPSQSPWTNPDTGVVYNWVDPPGTWVPEGEDEEYVLKEGDTMEGRLNLLIDLPVNQEEASNKEYVDSKTTDLALLPDTTDPNPQENTLDDRYVNLVGDTMTGALYLSADPTLPLEAASKQYVDSQTSNIYQSLVTIEEEIEFIAPSRERGNYTYTTGAVSAEGEFHLDTGSYASAAVLTISEVDNDGVTHGYSEVEIGDQIEILEADTPNGLLADVTSVPTVAAGVVTIGISVQRSLGNPVNGGVALVKVFKVSETNLNLQDLEAKFVRKDTVAGDTMIGPLTLPSDPTVDLHAATKQYVDTRMPLDISTLPPL